MSDPISIHKYPTWTHFTVLPHVMGEEEVVAIDTLEPLARNNLLHFQCWNTLLTHRHAIKLEYIVTMQLNCRAYDNGQ